MLKVTTAMLCYVALCPPSSGLKVPKSYATLGFPDAHDAFSGYPALEYRHGMGMASDAPNEINKRSLGLRIFDLKPSVDYSDGVWEIDQLSGHLSWILNGHGKMRTVESQLHINEFCNALPGSKNILIVGDSHNHQFYQVLTEHLNDQNKNFAFHNHLGIERFQAEWRNGAYMESIEWLPDQREMIPTTHKICDGAASITFIRNDWLDCAKHYNTFSDNWGTWCSTDCKQGEYSDCYCAPWADPAFLKDFDILLLNAGLHNVPDLQYNDTLSKTIVYLKDTLRNDQQVFFRTTVPGMGDCKTMGNGTFSSLSEAEQYSKEHPWHHSYHVKKLNDIARKLFSQAGYNILDVYKSTMLLKGRRHSSKDCLHFGDNLPLAHWIDLLYNQLLDHMS